MFLFQCATCCESDPVEETKEPLFDFAAEQQSAFAGVEEAAFGQEAADAAMAAEVEADAKVAVTPKPASAPFEAPKAAKPGTPEQASERGAAYMETPPEAIKVGEQPQGTPAEALAQMQTQMRTDETTEPPATPSPTTDLVQEEETEAPALNSEAAKRTMSRSSSTIRGDGAKPKSSGLGPWVNDKLEVYEKKICSKVYSPRKEPHSPSKIEVGVWVADKLEDMEKKISENVFGKPHHNSPSKSHSPTKSDDA